MDDFLHTFFDWDEIWKILPTLLTEGIRNTLIIAVSAVLLGLVLALGLMLMLMSPKLLVRAPARVFVDVFRGLPALLTISLVGLGFPAAHIRPFGTSPYGYAILGVGLVSAAYTTEILRAGIQSVASGQMQAGRSLGMSYFQAMRVIVIPQGIRNVLPALTNRFIIDIKESSLVYLLGLSAGQRELYFIAYQQQSVTYNSSALVAAGMCYLMMTIPLTYVVNAWDRRLRTGGTRRPVKVMPKVQPAGAGE